MNLPIIQVVVEGDTDVPFVERLCTASGFEVRAPMIAARGKSEVDKLIPGYARAGRGWPHLVVRDLDQDAACAPGLVDVLLATTPGDYFALRIAVRAVESWFLADRDHAARALSVKASQITLRPDDEPDPKRTIVDLAQRSTKPEIKRAIVPPPHFSRKSGPGYEAWLLKSATAWRLDRALANSPSLASAQARLTDLCRRWQAER